MTSAKFADKINSLFEEFIEMCNEQSLFDCDFDTLKGIWLSNEMQSKILGINKVKKDKKSKKKKDKNAPKKGKTAFIFWSNEERARIAKEVEQGKIDKYDNKEIISVLASRWKSYKEDGGDISKYEEMALKDKERYEKEKSEYSGSDEEVEADGVKNSPKRNKSAYLFYTSDKTVRSELKARMPDITNNEIIKKLAEQWKSLDSNEAQKYHDMATEDKKRYDAERTNKPIEKTKKQKKIEEKEEVDVKEVEKDDEEEIINIKKTKNKRKVVESDNEVEEEEEEQIIKKKRKNKRKVVDDDE